MSELLKNAIADAKAVRATALANAKAALEEAFTPRIQSMLSAKLEEDSMDEEMDADVAPVVEEVPAEDTMDEDTIPKVEKDPQGQGNEVKDGFKKDDKSLTSDLSGSEMVSKSPLKAHTKDPQGQGDEVTDGAKKDDKSVTHGLKENEMCPADEDLDEVVRELTAEVDDEVPSEAPVSDVGGDEDVSIDIDVDVPQEDSHESADEAGKDRSEEELDLEEILRELDGKEDECGSEVGNDDPMMETIKTENTRLKSENEEYRTAVTEIRTQLDEVNLLNAKLLYTNKLFRSYNLSNSQKMKVVESFDLTKCVREVKLIYATLAESFNFGATSKKGSITEGLASKPVASTRSVKTEILTEGSEMASRFQKLAGIGAKKKK